MRSRGTIVLARTLFGSGYARIGVVFLMICVAPIEVFAGPNAGGTLVLSANTSITYTTSASNYCGQSALSTCGSATVTVPANPAATTVFFALSAFPDSSSPRLKGLTFGISYDATKFDLVSLGGCGDHEMAGGGWPASAPGPPSSGM